ncbi:MAG: transcriptional regulator [Gammaproteobacteria bacterium]|nr:transcriptional regulator [Gammaproteobacteria bacterium]
MIQAKITTIGNSLGLVLPKEALARLHAQKGDILYLCEAPDGYTLTAYNAEFVEQMSMAEKIMHDDKDILKVLANS